jgi:ribosomal protein L11 methyltransferase
MPFLQLTLTIGSADPAPFENALLAAGALSITLQDAADDPVLEPAPGTTPLWPSVQVSALFDAALDPAAITAMLGAQLPSPLPGLSFQRLADRVWEREWLKDFHPMRFGRRLWICPDGQRPSLDLEPTPQTPGPKPCFIDLDPGLAFGTGTHPTTALCLEWLDSAQLHGKTIIDYGCGSGVLVIAALKLGAAAAVAVDIDPQAVTATLDNAQRNGVAERLVVSTVAQMHAQPADILLANILAEPLEQLASVLSGLVVAGGSIVLSGLLRAQAQHIADCYAPWFALHPAFKEEWARLDGARRFA